MVGAMFGCSKFVKTTVSKSKSSANMKITSKQANDIINHINSKTLEKLKKVYPELYNELLKLPDMTEVTDKNKNVIEQIARLGLSNVNKPIFELLLNEGLKTKRKYCTPLEALFWVAYDGNIDKLNHIPREGFSVSSFVQDAWMTSSTSNIFSSKRWKDFNEVADRLNSPQLIAIYMKLNIKYSYTTYEKEGVKSALEIFKDAKGACYDQALFASYLLRKNGYAKAWGTSVIFDKLVDGFYVGHVGSIYIDPKDNRYYIMDFTDYKIIFGPYTSLTEAAKQVCYAGSRGKANLKSYKCYDIDLVTGTYIKSSDYFSE